MSRKILIVAGLAIAFAASAGCVFRGDGDLRGGGWRDRGSWHDDWRDHDRGGWDDHRWHHDGDDDHHWR